MKNQYVGDIGDYGKYSLLRAFINAGVKVGINWYLTDNDGSNDGKFTDYLNKDAFRRYDPAVFDALKGIAFNSTKSVEDVQKSGILGDSVFYSELLHPQGRPSDRQKARGLWFEKSIRTLKDAELVFMDPDNGLMEKGDASKKGAEKFVLPDEVARYYKSGHSVVYYCHKGRRKMDDWIRYKNYMLGLIPDAKPYVLTYHKGSQRSYVFLTHEKNFGKYCRILDTFMENWINVFNEE